MWDGILSPIRTDSINLDIMAHCGRVLLRLTLEVIMVDMHHGMCRKPLRSTSCVVSQLRQRTSLTSVLCVPAAFRPHLHLPDRRSIRYHTLRPLVLLCIPRYPPLVRSLTSFPNTPTASLYELLFALSISSGLAVPRLLRSGGGHDHTWFGVLGVYPVFCQADPKLETLHCLIVSRSKERVAN
jgi:hypothetical protein